MISKHYVKIFGGIYSSLGLCYIMFYQNSNDLVKNASVSSGHVQNSNATREVLLKQPTMSSSTNVGTTNVGTTNVVYNKGDNHTEPNPSLSIGTTFQNMVHGFIEAILPNEGFEVQTSGIKTEDLVKDIASDAKKFSEQEIAYNNKLVKTMDFIDNKNPSNPRITWVEVTDSAGSIKYGYITKDGIFQIWNSPNSPVDNWVQTDKMKQNTSVIGCPRPETMSKIKIAGTWDSIKPYDMVYSASDTGRKNPVFMLVNANIRDPKTSHNRKGVFSCGNERGNVFVSERPSADFDMAGPVKNGCYTVKRSGIGAFDFVGQWDLNDASISQCKRRAEDFGSSVFFLIESENKNADKGACYISTPGIENPSVSNYFEYDETGNSCHRVNNKEGDEDGFMKAYPTTVLPRVYGNRTSRGYSAGLYSLKKGGPTGVDNGPIGKLAYINHNGEKHEYPQSALTYKSNVELESRPAPPCPAGWWPHNNECLQVCSVNSQSRHPDGTCICNQGGSNQNCNSAFKCLSNRCTRSKSGLPFEQNGQYVTLKGYDTFYNNNTYGLKQVQKQNTFPPLGNMPNWELNIRFELYTAQNMNRSELETRPSLVNGKCGASSDAWGAIGGECYPQCAYNSQARAADGKCICGKAYPNDVCGPQQFQCISGKCERPAPSWRPLIGDMYNNVNTRGWGVWISPENKIHWSFKQSTYDANVIVKYGVHYFLKIINTPTTMTITLIHVSTGEIQKDSFTKPKNAVMTTNGPVTIGGWLNNPNEKFLGEIHAVIVPKLYSTGYVSKKGAVAPLSNPMPVGVTVQGTMNDCRKICDPDEKCGGFVYTKGTGTEIGTCEMKDRSLMYPRGVRVPDPTKDLVLKVPNIKEDSIKDPACRNEDREYSVIDTAQYAHYPSRGVLSSTTKCNVKDMIPKDGSLQLPDIEPAIDANNLVIEDTQEKTNEYRQQTTSSAPPSTWNNDPQMEQPQMEQPQTESFTTLREGLSYADTMSDVNKNLKKIAKAEYQRERLIAIANETNKVLIAESYKFILWSILAILVVLALIKLKEMFGQDDIDKIDTSNGLVPFLLGLFGIGKVDTSDIADKTGDIKNALSSVGNDLKEAGEQFSNNITEGADKLVSSANQAAMGAMESAQGLADKVSETATDAVNSVGDAVSGDGGGGGGGNNGATTGGKRTYKKK